MTVILERRFQPTLAALAADPGCGLEAWTFDDEPRRRAAERALAERGVRARIRSAYKPLLHFFLEETAGPFARIRIACPEPEGCPEARFRIEAYPLAAMVGEAKLEFVPGGRETVYGVELTRPDGTVETHRVFAPNRRHVDPVGEDRLSPTGWLRITDAEGRTVRDGRLETDVERLFAAAVGVVAAHDWQGSPPWFEELSLRVGLPAEERPLAVEDEVLSLREAVHEDLYFSLLEIFQRKCGLSLGDRTLQPGQIVPEVAAADGDLSLTVETRPFDAAPAPTGYAGPLADADAPLAPEAVAAELARIPGEPFAVRSRTGRPVSARHHSGSDVAVMISGGQHANETTGVVGALRGAALLAARPGTHFTVAPLENPDGYALHRRLCADNPRHMHHAARYTALGDDLEYRTRDPLYESAIRIEALRRSGARLHLNLHGYPAHEWTRPFSGYSPRGFEMWALPRGFFLIVRHRGGWEERAHRFVEAVTCRLGEVPGLVAFNAGQLRLYAEHVGAVGFPVVNGFPCLFTADDDMPTPLKLTTEYPDETVYGPAFAAGCAAQTAAVLAAYDAFQALMAENP